MTARELVSLIDAELQRLPEKYRSPLVLCCLEGRTHSEAAAELACPLGTLRSRLQRGRELLRGRLARRGVALPAALLGPTLAHGAVSAGLRSAALRAAAGNASARVAALALEAGRATFPFLRVGALLLLSLATAGAALLPVARPTAAPPPAPAARLAAAPRQDVDGQRLPAGAVARLGTLRFRQGGWLRGLALSADGKLLATGGGDRARLWDAASGREVRSLPVEGPGGCEALALSPDARTIAVGSRFGGLLLDASSGKVIHRLNVGVASVAFARDGKAVATAGAGGWTLWDTATGKVLTRHDPGGANLGDVVVRTLAASPSGRLLAWGFGNEATVRDLRPGKTVDQRFDHGAPVSGVALSADNRLLASAGNDRCVKLWDIATGRRLHTLKGHTVVVKALAFTADGKLLASGGGDALGGGGRELHAIRLWDVATGKEQARLGRHGEGVTALCFAPDGKVLYADGHMSVRRWNVTAHKELLAGPGHHGWVGAIAFAPDGKTVATGGSDTTVRLWDLATRKERRQFQGCEAIIDSVVFSPDGKKLAAGCRDARVVVWDATTGQLLARLQPGKDGWETRAAFSPDGKLLAAASRDGQVVVYDAATLKEVRRLLRSEQGVMSLAFAPDSRQLAIGCIEDRKEPRPDLVRLWDVTTGKEVRRYTGQPELMIKSVCFSPDGRLLAAGGWSGAIQLWDSATGTPARRLMARGSSGSRAFFSPDGRMLAATGHDGIVYLWEVATGAQRRRWTGHLGMSTALAVAPGGQLVARGGMDTTVLLWSVGGSRGKANLSAADLAAHWAALAGTDGIKAYDAILTLAAAPDAAVPFLRARVRPAPGQAVKVEKLLAELDGDDFDTRDKATTALAQRGAAIEPALRQALAGKPSLEVRLRVAKLLRQVLSAPLPAEEVRRLRAVEALEYAATPEARRLLEALARGAPEATLTQAAKAALTRLGR
jgi:WD40 repeat protein